MKKIVLFTLDVYKRAVSPYLATVLGGGCKYEITCSTYARQTIKKEGVLKGSLLAGKRFLTCVAIT